MNCKNCNAELQEDAAFCSKCCLCVNETQMVTAAKKMIMERSETSRVM